MTRPRLLVSGFLVLVFTAGCGGQAPESANVSMLGGNARRGAATIARKGCGSCHMIPGVAGADGLVGPPLIHWSRRSFIAGAVPNSPDNLIRWIENPNAVEPGTAMPDLKLTPQEARDVAAYLHTLR